MAITKIRNDPNLSREDKKRLGAILRKWDKILNPSPADEADDILNGD